MIAKHLLQLTAFHVFLVSSFILTGNPHSVYVPSFLSLCVINFNIFFSLYNYKFNLIIVPVSGNLNAGFWNPKASWRSVPRLNSQSLHVVRANVSAISCISELYSPLSTFHARCISVFVSLAVANAPKAFWCCAAWAWLDLWKVVQLITPFFKQSFKY